jgi:transposase
MPKYVTLHAHLSIDDLERRYRSAHEPHERSWWQILWRLSRGQSARQVAQSTGYSPYWIGQLAKRYNTQGPAGMRNRAHIDSYRRPPLLNAALQEELRGALLALPPGGQALWTGRLVAAWMSERLGRPVAVQRGWDYLQRLGQSPQVPRQRHVHADPAAQDRFKKSSARL